MPKPGSTDGCLLRATMRARWLRWQRLDGPPARLRSAALPSHPPSDARDGTRRWIRAKQLIALLAAMVVLAGCSSEAETPELNGIVLDRPYAAPATPLTDTDGTPYSLADETDRRLTLVFFGFINCPDICHTVMAALTSGLTRLDEEEREQVDVVFVTTDPARDTEQVLRRYLDRYDDSYVGLTGKLDTIVDVAKPLAVAVEQGEKLPSGGYDVTHSTHVLGIASDDKAPILWTQDTSAAQFAEDFGVLLSGSGPALNLKP